MLLKQLWTVVWSLDSLLFVEKKNKKSIAKRAEHTRNIAAHTSVKTYCGVQRLAWKWNWQWRGRGGKRNANTTHHTTLLAHTHTHAFTTPGSLSVCECVRVCVCVRQCAYVCCCSCCCFSCCGALEMLSLFTSSLSQVFSAPVCVEENRLCFSVGDLIWGNSFRTCNWPLKGASRWFQKILTNVNNSLYFQF